MNWHRVFVLCTIILLLASSGVSAAEERGFWARVKAIFSDDAPVTEVQIPEPEPVKGDVVQKQDEGSEPTEVVVTNQEQRSCNRCQAIVCKTTLGKQFLCPGTLESCELRYDGCEELGCYPSTVCEYNGQKYGEGETYPAGDGCNSCTCAGKESQCTQQICENEPECKQDSDCPVLNCIKAPCPTLVCEDGSCVQREELRYCIYNDQKVAVGESFPSSDGCNSCSCTASGRVVCTERMCPKEPDERVECKSDFDCPQIVCVRAPCNGYVCDAGQCVLADETTMAK